MKAKLRDLFEEYARLPDWADVRLIDANTPNNFGDRPLDTAAVRGNLNEISLLIAAGANIRAAGEHKYTALHSAVEQGHIDAVRLLVEHGADLFAESDDGMTPLDLAEALEEREISALLRVCMAIEKARLPCRGV
jgi:ankyrin repeat protein